MRIRNKSCMPIPVSLSNDLFSTLFGGQENIRICSGRRYFPVSFLKRLSVASR